MLSECAKCGAPLDVRMGMQIVRCAYCASSNQVPQMRVLSQETPAGWLPPETWSTPQTPTRVRAGSSGGILVAVAVVAVLILGGAVFAVLQLGTSKPPEPAVAVTAIDDPKPVPPPMAPVPAPLEAENAAAPAQPPKRPPTPNATEARTAPPPATTTTPSPPKTTRPPSGKKSCGCAPGDLACNMRCASK